MANIHLTPSHKPLIKSALQLGDWLLKLDKLSEQDKQAITAVQAALSKLPKVKDGTLAMYGFSVEKGDDKNGLVRGWDISLEYFANDTERQGGLELFSSFIPIPESTDKAVLVQKTLNENYFHWPIGDVCAFIKPEDQKQWIGDVNQPLQYLDNQAQLRVEIVFGDYYAEHTFSANDFD
jgi:hypothetical protein